MDNKEKKILIVDDDETSRSLIRQTLCDYEHMYEAADGVAALWVENNNGTLTAYALGAAPSAAMTAQCTVTEVTA